MINYHRLFNGRKVRNGVLQALPFWIASLITGLVAVLYTRLFDWAEALGISVCKPHGWLIFLLSPLSFLLAWLLVKRVDVYARGSGIPQVMAAIELTTPKNDEQVKRLLNMRMLAVKILSQLTDDFRWERHRPRRTDYSDRGHDFP